MLNKQQASLFLKQEMLYEPLEVLTGFLDASVAVTEHSKDEVLWLHRVFSKSQKQGGALLDEIVSSFSILHINDRGGWESFSSEKYKECHVFINPVSNPLGKNIVFWVAIKGKNPLSSSQKKLVLQTFRLLENEMQQIAATRLLNEDVTGLMDERFRLLFENSPVGFFFFDKELHITMVNELFCDTLKQPKQLLLGFDLNNMIDDRVLAIIQKTINGHRGSYEGKYHSALSPPNVLDIRLKTSPVFSPAGDVVGGFGTVEDISGIASINKELEENNLRLHTLINSTPDFICFKDDQGRWIEANQSLIDLFGLGGVDYRGKSYSDLAQIVPSKEKALKFCHETDNLAWKKGRPVSIEEHITNSEGELKVYDVIKVPLYNSDRSRKGLVILGRDITDRKKAEKETKEREDRFRLVAMHTNDVIFEWEGREQTFSWHGNVKSVLGDEPTPQNVRQLFFYIHPEDRSRLNDVWKLGGLRQKLWKEEFRLLLPEGIIKHLKGSGIIEVVADGDMKAYGTITNITTESQLIQTLKDTLDIAEINHFKLRGLLGVIPDVMFVFDKDGVFIDYHSDSDERLIMPPDVFLNRDVDQVLSPDLAALTKEKIAMVMKTRELETYNYSFELNGQKHVFEARMIYFRPGEVLCIVRDVTQAKQMEKDLIASKQRAEEGEKLKGAFLANMSHEIRTPLNGIMGFAELLRNENLLPEKKNRYLDIIVESSLQLLGIINDVMEISRLETGQVSLSSSDLDLSELVSSLSAFFEIPANEKGITLKTALTEKGKDIIQGDLRRLTQVFHNLISNALKHTPDKGIVEFGYQLREDDTRFFVKDNGIGIPAIYHDIIFKRFRQVNPDHGEAKSGAGLGLSICKSLVELMGGEIWVESRPGKGSSFYFTISESPFME